MDTPLRTPFTMTPSPAEADDAAGQGEERLVDVGAALVADQQAAEAVQPGDAALHHPALATAARAVLDPATADLRPGPPLADLSAVTVVVVAAVGEQASGTSPRLRPRPLPPRGPQAGD